MGIVYFGLYADAIDSYSHEGYAARVRPDGSETSVWTYETREFVGYRACCECGWRGSTTYPPTQEGEDQADEEWDHDHLRPLIDAAARAHTVTGDVLLAFVRELRGSLQLQETTDAQGGVVLTEHSRGVLAAVERLEQLLDDQSGGTPS
ncbi:MAG: hypothetical protein GEV28_34530 [Actinophytocola sp.]|uniref:hypothetical protein n=1 Tax=Actinophytocola sp. TaxID=1872138 RepID=UPI0013254633|nr:hypothetical protein [Actinophytocola sp.]MPZ85232.1 hypothetical protein [Actinophytocola sp.]